MRIDSVTISFVLVIWLLIATCVVSSVLHQPFTKKQRLFWILFVLGAPMIGVLAYLPFSFNKEEVPDIFLMRNKRGKHRSGGGGNKGKR
jgi:hypothetical protein